MATISQRHAGVSKEEEMQHFALTLTERNGTHEQWLSVVLYSIKALLDNQPLLIEIITREAGRLADRAGAAGSVSVETQRIFDELKLRIVAA